MPRAARGIIGGQVYHVLNRGNGRANVFHKPADFVAFVKLIGEAKQRYPVKLQACCLMTSHVRRYHQRLLYTSLGLAIGSHL